METSAVHFEVDTGHWTGCAMQEDTSQEKSAVDFVDNKWTSSTQVLVTFLQSSVDNNTVFFLYYIGRGGQRSTTNATSTSARTRWTRAVSYTHLTLPTTPYV